MAVDPAPAAGPVASELLGTGPAPVPRPRADSVRGEQERWLRRLRLQRRLHDGAALRISALATRLGVVEHGLPDDRPELRDSIAHVQAELHAALQELRWVAREIYPPLLELAGLGAALREAAGGVAVPVVVVAPPDRFSAPVEGAVYFAVTDCLRALPPGGGEVHVVLRRDGDLLITVVDGVPHHLAAEVLEQVRGLGGQVATRGDPAAGTIEVGVPCA